MEKTSKQREETKKRHCMITTFLIKKKNLKFSSKFRQKSKSVKMHVKIQPIKLLHTYWKLLLLLSSFIYGRFGRLDLLVEGKERNWFQMISFFCLQIHMVLYPYLAYWISWKKEERTLSFNFGDLTLDL